MRTVIAVVVTLAVATTVGYLTGKREGRTEGLSTAAYMLEEDTVDWEARLRREDDCKAWRDFVQQTGHLAKLNALEKAFNTVAIAFKVYETGDRARFDALAKRINAARERYETRAGEALQTKGCKFREE